MEGGTGKSQKSSAAAVGAADADWDGSSTAVSVCRHTADNVADGSSRLPSEGGLGVAAAESEVVGLEDRAGQGRNDGRRSGWLSG